MAIAAYNNEAWNVNQPPTDQEIVAIGFITGSKRAIPNGDHFCAMVEYSKRHGWRDALSGKPLASDSSEGVRISAWQLAPRIEGF